MKRFAAALLLSASLASGLLSAGCSSSSDSDSDSGDSSSKATAQADASALPACSATAPCASGSNCIAGVGGAGIPRCYVDGTEGQYFACRAGRQLVFMQSNPAQAACL